jgi:hypothetical protein
MIKRHQSEKSSSTQEKGKKERIKHGSVKKSIYLKTIRHERGGASWPATSIK